MTPLEKRIKQAAREVLPPWLHVRCRVAYRRGVRCLKEIDYALDRRGLSLDQFVEELRKLGFVRGACVYVHTSMNEITRRVPDINAHRLVNLLQELVGKDGTLLAPTFPFLTRQYYYVQKCRVFDVHCTPSMVGLFTEVFRRGDGVLRSLHPTHPIAAWGRHSKELVAHHHLGTAFGKTSPVYKMQELDGFVAGIGVVPMRCFTLYHMAEELHPKSHAIHYGSERYPMTILNGTERVPYVVTPLRADRVRRYDRAESILKREGVLLYYAVKGLKFSKAPVQPFLQRALELIGSDSFYLKTGWLCSNQSPKISRSQESA